MHRAWLVLFTVTLFSLGAGAVAAPIVLDAEASGAVSQDLSCASIGCFALEYASTSPLEDLGFSFSIGIGNSTGTTALGYAVFDLGAFSGTALDARLVVDLQYANTENSQLTVRTVDTATASELFTNPPGSQSAALNLSNPPATPDLYGELASQYQALATGTELAVLAQAGAFNTLFEIELSNIVLDLINANDGLFAIGLDWTSGARNRFPFGSDIIAFNTAPRLILTKGNTDLPAPATLWLVVGALALLFLKKQSLRANDTLSTANDCKCTIKPTRDF